MFTPEPTSKPNSWPMLTPASGSLTGGQPGRCNEAWHKEQVGSWSKRNNPPTFSAYTCFSPPSDERPIPRRRRRRAAIPRCSQPCQHQRPDPARYQSHRLRAGAGRTDRRCRSTIMEPPGRRVGKLPPGRNPTARHGPHRHHPHPRTLAETTAGRTRIRGTAPAPGTSPSPRKSIPSATNGTTPYPYTNSDGDCQ